VLAVLDAGQMSGRRGKDVSDTDNASVPVPGAAVSKVAEPPLATVGALLTKVTTGGVVGRASGTVTPMRPRAVPPRPSLTDTAILSVPDVPVSY
jgi:hypothetical protein